MQERVKLDRAVKNWLASYPKRLHAILSPSGDTKDCPEDEPAT